MIMKEKERKPFVGEILTYEKDIKPYKVIHIYSGVGSGKNTFVENFDTIGIKYLELTSRRAKVNEVGKTYKGKKNISRYVDYVDDDRIAVLNQMYDIEFSKHNPKQSTVTTYGMLEFYYENYFDTNDPESWIENIYDCIITDENHSVILDSNYQSSVYYVDDLISKIIYNFKNNIEMRCKHLILMTATPDVLGSYYNISGSVTYDLRNVCMNLYPRKIRFTEKYHLKKLISRLLVNNKKVIYFTNEVIFPADWVKGTKIPVTQVVFSVTNETRRDELFLTDPDSYARMKEFEEYLSENKKFPDGINFLITTSRYKEGIDINEDIAAVFVDQHNESDVRQMAGRVRGNLEVLYVVTDSKQFSRKDEEDNLKLDVAYELVDLANEKYKEAEDEKSRRRVIRTFQSTTEFLKFSYGEEKFIVRDLRKIRNDYLNDQEEAWKNCSGKYEDIVSEWYPDSEVEPYERNQSNEDANLKKKISKLEEFVNSNYEIEKEYTIENISMLINYINKYWDKKNINPILKYINLKCVRTGSHGESRKLINLLTSKEKSL